MRKAKKSVSALIVALCMLVQLIPAFPVQTASAADADIVLDFYNGTGYTVASDSTFAPGKQTQTDAETGETIYVLYGQIQNKAYIAEFTVSETGYYEYDPYIYSTTFRPGRINVRVETPVYEGAETRASVLCQTAIMTTGYDNYKQHSFRINDTSTKNVLIAKAGDGNGAVTEDTYADRTVTVTTPADNLPHGGYVYLTKGTNRFIVEHAGDNPHVSLSSVKFTKVDDVQAHELKLTFTKDANITADASGNKKLTYAAIPQTGYSLTTKSALAAKLDANTADNMGSNPFHGSLKMNSGYILAADFYVPAAGYYDASVLFRIANDYGGNFNVYVGQGTAADWKTNTTDWTYAGTFYGDNNNHVTGNMHTLGLKTVYLNEGINTVVFENGPADCLSYTENGTVNNQYYLYIGNISFTPVAETATCVDAVKLTAPSNLVIGKTYSASAVVNMFNGAQVPNDATVTFTADVPLDGNAIVNISEDGRTITPVKVGTTNINAVVTYGEARYEDRVQVTVSEYTGEVLNFTDAGTDIPYSQVGDRQYSLLKDATLENAGWRVTTNAAVVPLLDHNVSFEEAGWSYVSAHMAGVKLDTTVEIDGVERNQVAAFDFEVGVAGWYDVSANLMQSYDYGGIFNVYVGSYENTSNDWSDASWKYAGKLYGDHNGAFGIENASFKDVGLKTIYLEEGLNTVVFETAYFDNVVTDSGIHGKGPYLYLKSLSFTPAAADTAYMDEVKMTVSETAFEVGGTANASAVINMYSGSSAATVEIGSFNPEIVSVENGVITAKKAGETSLYAVAYDANGVRYEDRIQVTVSGKPSANIGTAEEGSPFASKYAYIEENKNGTFNVTFIGGIDELVGYTAVGFEIDVAGDKAYSDDAKVYEKLTVNGSTYTAEKDYEAEYIFVGSRDEIAAGSTVVARPYVVVDGEKQFLANATLTLQF